MPLENPNPDDNFESAFTNAASAQQAEPPAPATPPVSQQPAEVAPVTAPTTTAPPAADQPPTATSPSPSAPVLSPYALAAQEAGLPYQGLTDAQIAQAMAQHIVRNRPYADYGQQLAPHAEQIRAYFDQQQAPPTPAPAPAATPADPDAWDADKYFAEKWNVPAWSEKFDYVIQNGMVQRNAETGLFEATPGFESTVMPILPGLNEAQGMNAQRWQGITRGNPYQQFYDVLQEPMRQAWRDDLSQMLEERLTRQQQEQRINDFETAQASWLYGVDPTNGQRVLTSQGQAFYQAIATLREDGVTDPQRLLERAMQLTGRTAAFAQPTQTAPAIQPVAPVAPVVPPPPVAAAVPSQQPQQTFLQNALERASYSPNSGGFSQAAADHPVSVNEAELNSMFTSALQQARAGST